MQRVGHEDVLGALTAGVVVVAHDGRVQYANPGAGRIVRKAPEEMIGRQVGEVLVPLDCVVAAAEVPDCRRESVVRFADGKSTTIGFSVSAPSARGSRTILFQEITNVLELRRERDRLLQMAALGDALPSILHELRNPLAAMAAMLEGAGVPSDGIPGALRQSGLLVIYQAVSQVFEKDDTADSSKTMAALDSRLKRAEKWVQFVNKYTKRPPKGIEEPSSESASF